MIVNSPVSLDYPEVPAGAVLAGAANRWGDRVAIHLDGRELTFAELYRQACAFAHALHGSGVGRGDVVAIHCPTARSSPSPTTASSCPGLPTPRPTHCCRRVTWPRNWPTPARCSR